MTGELDLAPTGETVRKDDMIRAMLAQESASALIIGRRDDFAWATTGGDAALLWTDSQAAGYLVITPNHKYLVSSATDNARLATEECQGQGYEPVSVRWTEGDPAEVALLRAGRGRILSDCRIPGTADASAGVRGLHYPLSEFEQRRLRWVCARLDRIVRDTADRLEPGMSEREVQATLAGPLLADGFTIDALMVGFDERVYRYRHPQPRGNTLDRYAFLHLAVSRWGLHGVCTRLVHFGPPPGDLRKRFEAASQIEAFTIDRTRPGTTFGEVFDGQVELYGTLGFAGEWRNHFQGGLTGYIVNEPAHATRPGDPIPEGSLFNWYITITGTKKEETTLATPNGGDVLTLSGAWPVESHGAPGRERDVAAMLVR